MRESDILADSVLPESAFTILHIINISMHAEKSAVLLRNIPVKTSYFIQFPSLPHSKATAVSNNILFLIK